MRKKLFLILIVIAISSLAISTTAQSTFACNATESNTVLKNLSCKVNDCPGYEGIYTYDEEPSLSVTGGYSVTGRYISTAIKNIDITTEVIEVGDNTTARFGYGDLKPAKYELYKITVHNNGDVELKDVRVSAELAEGMQFENTSYYDKSRGRLDVIRDPIDYKDKVKTKLEWNIGTLGSEEIKSIILGVYLKPEVNNKLVAVQATSTAPDGTTVKDSQATADVRECSYRDPQGQPCAIPSSICKKTCPTWSQPK